MLRIELLPAPDLPISNTLRVFLRAGSLVDIATGGVDCERRMGVLCSVMADNAESGNCGWLVT